MKPPICVGADSGLVQTAAGTAAKVNDVTQASSLVHGEETVVVAVAGYLGVSKREETQDIDATWHVTMQPGKRKALDKATQKRRALDEREHVKASIRTKVEHLFRVIKRHFGHVKMRYRGMIKNTVQLLTLFVLSNLWIARKRLLNLVRG